MYNWYWRSANCVSIENLVDATYCMNLLGVNRYMEWTLKMQNGWFTVIVRLVQVPLSLLLKWWILFFCYIVKSPLVALYDNSDKGTIARNKKLNIGTCASLYYFFTSNKVHVQRYTFVKKNDIYLQRVCFGSKFRNYLFEWFYIYNLYLKIMIQLTCILPSGIEDIWNWCKGL